VTSKLDHVLMVNHLIPAKQIELLKTITDRLMIVPFQPTTENIVVYIAEILQQHLPSDVKLYSVRLYETLTSFADWFADDN
jgi:6-pyruvoyltetrahydropterin/6-carboxytetrahydropterin synthase